MKIEIYYELRLAAPGAPGERSVAEGYGIFQNYTSLHAVFESWLGDELVVVLPCFLVTASLGSEFLAKGFSGFDLETVEVEKDVEFYHGYPDVELPHFFWLKVNGAKGEDDFIVTERHRIAVSARAFEVIDKAKLPCMTFTEYLV